MACPGQVVVLTCREVGSRVLVWNTDRFGEAASYAFGSAREGVIIRRNIFTANLTKTVMEDSVVKLTSTLSFTFVDTLNGLAVECRTLVSNLVVSRRAIVETRGIAS